MTTMWDHLRRSALLLAGVACMILTAAGAAAGQAAGAAAGQDPFEGVARADVLLLGTFHFDDPGLDDYKPQFPWDPFSPEHQREIEEVVELLARYGPTQIALEWPANRQAELDSLYTAYALLARHQLLEARYAALHRFNDSLKVTMPLRDYLVRRNDPAEVRVSHGQYLIGGFRLGRDDDYLGPDMRTRWYNRNLRIFHNLQRITSSPDERLLVIIGAGHVPILRHAIEASPEFRLVEVRDVLGG